jgi:hypothetical protein
LRVRNAVAVLNLVLLELYRVDPFRQEAAAVGVDKPEQAIALVYSKESTWPEAAVGNAAPSGFWHLNRHQRTEFNDCGILLVCRQSGAIY